MFQIFCCVLAGYCRLDSNLESPTYPDPESNLGDSGNRPRIISNKGIRTMVGLRSKLLLLGVPALCLAAIVATYPANAVIAIDSRMAQPAWAVLERHVLEANAPVMAEFYHKYYDEWPRAVRPALGRG